MKKFRYVFQNIFNYISFHYLTLDNIENGEVQKILNSGMKKNSYRIIAKNLYTGLNDCNGKEIFEGDIIRSTSKMIKLKTFKPTGKISITDYYIVYIEKEARFATQKIGKNNHEVFHLRQKLIAIYDEVIGNIFENPELLEEK